MARRMCVGGGGVKAEMTDWFIFRELFFADKVSHRPGDVPARARATGETDGCGGGSRDAWRALM